MIHYPTFVNGSWHELPNRDRLEVENPADQSILGTIADCNANDAEEAVAAAVKAQKIWASIPAIERSKAVQALAEEVKKNEKKLAEIIVLEQGKPLSQAKGEVNAAVNFLKYASEHARRITGDIMQSDNIDEEIYVRRWPRGVVVGLTAWNYPLALAARKLGPALIAGNSFILLSHENTPISGIQLAQIADNLGFPAGVFSVLTGRGRVIGDALVAHPKTDMVTMTGSSRAGVEIYSNAANKLKYISLELGGKAPFIVMEDANISDAVDAAIIARFTNCGQICTCAERIYLQSTIADQFSEMFVERAKSITVGNPMTDPDMGPKISRVELEKVETMIKVAANEGAEILLQGSESKIFDKGYWIEPCIMKVTDNSAEIMQQEIFGPVAPIMTFDTFEQAIDLANETNFGLSAYLWTKNAKRIMHASRYLKFGELYFNRANGEQVQGFHTGWGMSGIGGEDGVYGFDSYFKKQTSYLNLSNF